MLFIYWAVWSVALCLLVHVNWLLLDCRTLKRAAGKSETVLRHSGDDGMVTRSKVKRSSAAGQPSSTVIRKQFHAVAVAMFLPGLLFDVSLLRVATGCSLVILVMLEVRPRQLLSVKSPAAVSHIGVLYCGFVVRSSEKRDGHSS